jgi:hypothetical protein
MFERERHSAYDAAVHASLSGGPTSWAAARKQNPLPDDCFRAIAASTGLDWLLVAQASSDTFFHLARVDHAYLSQLVDGWPAHGHAVRDVLAAKLRRALIRDPDRMPYDVVTLGARVDLTINRVDLETCLFANPNGQPAPESSVPITSAVGAILLGLTERLALRRHAPDGSAFTLQIRKVRQSRGSLASCCV